MKYLPLLLLTAILFISCNQPDTNNESEKVTEKEETTADTLGEEASLIIAQKKIQAFGVPTPNQVDSLKSTAHSLFEDEKYSAAIDSLKLFSKKANWLANLISAGLEPYYSSSYDDRENVPISTIRELSEFETQSNELKKDRNEAYIMIAEASVKTGEVDQATAYYFSALDLIDPESEELWDRARTGLYQLLKIDN